MEARSDGEIAPAGSVTDDAERFLALLEEVGAEVTAQSRPDQIVAVIARAAMAVDGVTGSTIGISLTDDAPLRLTRLDGFDDQMLDDWAVIPRTAEVPLTHVLGSGEPLAFSSRQAFLAQYPALRQEVERSDHHAWAVIPLKVGRVVKGVLGLTWSDAHRLAGAEMLFLSTLGKLGGEALVRSIRDRERQALLLRLADTVEHERAAIARDLHDDAVQRVAGIQFRLGSLDPARPAVARAIADCEQELNTVVRTLRDLVFTLHPPNLDGRKLGATILDFVGWRFGPEQDRVSVVDRIDREIRPGLALIAYRITQEALTNAHKHAGQARIECELRIVDDGWLRIRVSDDGLGTDVDTPESDQEGHIGFRTMQERAESIGGTLRFETTPGEGFTILARLPLVDAEMPPQPSARAIETVFAAEAEERN